MGLPAKLKNFILHVDGVGYAGEVGEVTVPKLSRKMEGWRGGGMGGEVKFDMGHGDIDQEFTCGGHVQELISQFGATRHDALQLRFTGAYQRDDTGQVYAVEMISRGRFEEIDFGNQKVGDDTEHKFKATCSYHKIVHAGEPLVEVDLVNNVFVVRGVDRMAEIRKALGESGSLSATFGGGLSINI